MQTNVVCLIRDNFINLLSTVTFLSQNKKCFHICYSSHNSVMRGNQFIEINARAFSSTRLHHFDLLVMFPTPPAPTSSEFVQCAYSFTRLRYARAYSPTRLHHFDLVMFPTSPPPTSPDFVQCVYSFTRLRYAR